MKRLDVLCYTSVTFKKHISKVTQSCYHHLSNIARKEPVLSFSYTQASSQLNYCDGLLTCISQKALNRLQIVQEHSCQNSYKNQETWTYYTSLYDSTLAASYF